jgi:hypothetical protein
MNRKIRQDAKVKQFSAASRVTMGSQRVMDREARISAETRAAHREDILGQNPFVLLAREAKLARQNHPDPRLALAKDQYERLLEQEIGARRGGRPRKIVGMNTRFGGRNKGDL